MIGRRLEAQRIVETIELLSRRINERFPGAGLHSVCRDLLQIAQQAQRRAEQIARPMYGVRLASALLILVILCGFGFTVKAVRLPDQPLQAGEFVQVIDAGFNALVLIGATVLFLVTLETRVKRARAMRAVHELRSLVHIVDMHQLTKDPERTLWRGPDTASSPKRDMNRFELNRYLDYCSEMFDLAGKIAALYVDKFPDSQAVTVVNDLQSLTLGMTRKVWQKIMILHTSHDIDPRHEPMQASSREDEKTPDEAVPADSISDPPG